MDLIYKLGLVSPLWLTAAGGLLVLMSVIFIRKEALPSRVASVFLFLTLLAAGAILVYREAKHGGAPTSLFGGMILLDSATCYAWVVLLLTGLFVSVFSDRQNTVGEVPRGETPALMLFALFGMMLMVSTKHLVTIFIGLETAAVGLYVLTGLRENRLTSLESSLKYLLPGMVGTAFFVYGIALIYCACGTLDCAVMASIAPEKFHRGFLIAGMLIMLAGLAFKMGIAPFHLWMPDVYQGAPTNVTAFMAVGVKAAAVIALIRIFLNFTPALDPDLFRDTFGYVLIALALLTMLAGNLAALRQKDFKRMLAFSGVAHAGYMLAGVAGAWFCDSEKGALAEATRVLLFYGLAYALMTLGAFGVIMALDRGKGEGEKISGVAGLSRVNVWLAAALTLFMLSLIGIPPLPGFWAKLYVLSLTIKGHLYWTAVLLALNSVISAFYYLKPVMLCWQDSPEKPAPAERGEVFYCAWLGAVNLLVGLAPFAFILA